MKKSSLVKIWGAIIFSMGIIHFLNSGLSMTGAFFGTSANVSTGFIISLILCILGLTIFSTANLLERVAEVRSSIKDYPSILRLTKEATKNQDVEREMNHLTEQLSFGNLEAGLGTPGHIKGTAIHYLRGRNGARLFYVQSGKDEYTIVGKSSKANEPQVIDKLKELYTRH